MVEFCYAECHLSRMSCHKLALYPECHFVECRYAECRVVIFKAKLCRLGYAMLGQVRLGLVKFGQVTDPLNRPECLTLSRFPSLSMYLFVPRSRPIRL
jgi:hypothetical protein